MKYMKRYLRKTYLSEKKKKTELEHVGWSKLRMVKAMPRKVAAKRAGTTKVGIPHGVVGGSILAFEATTALNQWWTAFQDQELEQHGL